MDKQESAAGRSRSEATARIAVLTGLPGLVLVVLAALTSNALALHADLILTCLDMLVLMTVWVIAFRGRGKQSSRERSALQRAEHSACTLAACCMILSMCVVAWLAVGRMAEGGLSPTGVGIGLVLNAVYAAANLFVLRRWRLRYREERTPFVRSQVCLFWDKLCTNLIVVISLGIGLCFPEGSLGRYVDPVAGLLIAATTARWTAPVLRDALRGAGIGWRMRQRRRTAMFVSGHGT